MFRYAAIKIQDYCDFNCLEMGY